jgi:glycosyltransferase involved in cell wall biosynthesis
MNENIELTIGIPTYNGHKYIKDAINSIIEQIDDINRNELEILISDNASTDETPDIIKKYVGKYPSLFSYYRNTENIGIDRNIDIIFKKAKGEFVWICGDDDQIITGQLKNVLGKIKNKKEISVFFVNASMYDRDMTKILQEHVLEIEEGIYSPDQYYNFVGPNAVLISTIIVKRELWPFNEGINEYTQHEWVTLYKIYFSLRAGKAYLISQSCVKYRGGSMRWHEGGKWLGLVLDLCDVLDNITNLGYSQSITNKHLNERLKVLPINIIDAKRNNWFLSKELKTKLKQRFGGHISYWLRSYPLLYTPNIFYEIAYRVCKMKLFNKACKKLISKMS